MEFHVCKVPSHWMKFCVSRELWHRKNGCFQGVLAWNKLWCAHAWNKIWCFHGVPVQNEIWFSWGGHTWNTIWCFHVTPIRNKIWHFHNMPSWNKGVSHKGELGNIEGIIMDRHKVDHNLSFWHNLTSTLNFAVSTVNLHGMKFGVSRTLLCEMRR